VTPPPGTTDPVPGNNTDGDTNPVGPEADLSVTKIDNPDPVIAGQNLTYAITVNNAGASDAQNVVVTDTLPSGVTFVSTSGCSDDPNGVPTCSLGTIAAKGSKQYTVTVTVNSGTTGTITNNVSVTSDTTDSDDTNNDASQDTTVNAPALFDPPSGFKTVNDSGYPELEWRMVWINNSNTAAMLVSIADPVPAGTTYVPGSVQCTANGGSSTSTCTFDAVNNRIIWEGNIAADPGATNEAEASNEVVITYRTTVGRTVVSVSNQGCAYWDANGNQSVSDDIAGNQTPVCSDDPNTTPSGDPTVWARTQLFPVPALNGWGVLIFMLLAGTGTVLLMRKQKRSTKRE
jgi:uncharacterized repeat protein (TIGR01451 family)